MSTCGRTTTSARVIRDYEHLSRAVGIFAWASQRLLSGLAEAPRVLGVGERSREIFEDRSPRNTDIDPSVIVPRESIEASSFVVLLFGPGSSAREARRV